MGFLSSIIIGGIVGLVILPYFCDGGYILPNSKRGRKLRDDINKRNEVRLRNLDINSDDIKEFTNKNSSLNYKL